MILGEHLQELHGLPAFTFPGPDDESGAALPDAGTVAWRIASDVYDSEEPWEAAFARFLGAVDTTRVRALIIGAWEEAYENSSAEVIGSLVAAKEQLPALRSLFLGDMGSEECEISWIVQSDVAPLLNAFPELEEFGVRGGNELAFSTVRHEKLRALTVQTGGLPAAVVRGIAASRLPELRHLDLWLGDEQYGGDAEVEDLDPFLIGADFPRLEHLALRNSQFQDEIAASCATAPVVPRLSVLDLSMGVLTDKGATALIEGQPLTHLSKLDLHHHYLGEEVKERIRETLQPSGVLLDLDEDGADSYEDDDGEVHRYVAVAE
ncbi:STM4015 family protein [Streptomyces physcomitrii]|uniref:Leucine-rich repeat domain-containing protein n=1 Tax=Streptomyces physcomitrii TaxID=2724184 RepID=A0ABX1HBF4_9ACTN|nr:STM4015 family protein [Streptomyces physcomitrii]NKI45382.1 leucine-rich repeat domain-containing protein [Streptomyces physcomitrii]